jgi:hypothetical protein
MEDLESFSISTIVPEGERPITQLQIQQSDDVCRRQGVSERSVFTVRALWDSGATSCFINNNMAHTMGLIEDGHEPVRSTHGREYHPVYYVDIDLGDGYSLYDHKVAGIETSEEFDFIIGMDVIRQGDFLLGETKGSLHVYFKPRGV